MASTDSNSSDEHLNVLIWRGGDDGAFKHYRVVRRANQTVLDIVTDVQRHQEPSLAYRFACRVGVCGSCAMTVNGKPRWTCRTHVQRVAKDNTLTVEPLANLPRIKDLVCDLTPFFEKWQKAGGRFQGLASRTDDVANIKPDSPARKAANAAIECINCAVCYSACDVVAWRPDYLGPAALNRVWTLLNDTRHARRKAVLNSAFADGGCNSCHSIGNCTRHCPVELSPAHSIAALKRLAFGGLPKDN